MSPTLAHPDHLAHAAAQAGGGGLLSLEDEAERAGRPRHPCFSYWSDIFG